LLLAQKKFRLFNLLSVLSPGLTVFFVMLLLRHFGPDKLFYLAGLAVSWLISFFLGLYFLQKQFVLTKISGGKSLWQTGFKNGLANQLSHLAGLLNNRFIYFLVPATLLGVYANALSLAEASLMIPTSIGQVLYASHLNNEKPTRFFETMAGNFLVNAVLLAGIAVLVLLIPASLYAYVFGPAFGGVKSYLALLSVFMIFYGGYLICSYRHSANGHFLYNFYANLAGTGINIAISLWYVVHNTYTPEKGIIALGSGFVAMFITSLILLNRKEIAARGKPFSPF
jgi:O-antigen/teichoic acid export membrane protein